MTAIKAEYVNYRRNQSRKVFQIILEVPEEHAAHVAEVLGWPNAGGSIWCGIARLSEEAEHRANGGTGE